MTGCWCAGSAPAQAPAGAVVLARFPSRPDLLVVKRVRRPVPGGVWVEGDKEFVADDSRAFGPAVVVGLVVARLWPRARSAADPASDLTEPQG